jgi:hypothetical protein
MIWVVTNHMIDTTCMTACTVSISALFLEYQYFRKLLAVQYINLFLEFGRTDKENKPLLYYSIHVSLCTDTNYCVHYGIQRFSVSCLVTNMGVRPERIYT